MLLFLTFAYAPVLAENTCTGLGNDMPNYMQLIPVGSLYQQLQTIPVPAQPPSLPPMPTLNASSVEEAPFPPVASRNESGGPSRGAETPSAPPSAAHKVTVSTSMLFVMVFAALLI
jgi:hypothetical protein